MSDPSKTSAEEHAVQAILASKNVYTYFQPVVSISGKSIIGFEAFSRGGGANDDVVDPAVLFHAALSHELKVGVDQLCREKALLQYKPIYDNHPDMLFFLNVNPDILENGGEKSEVLKHQVASLDIAPSRVVIELPLRRAMTSEIDTFIALYRVLGFKVCLDNCGVDDPFGQAISRMEPDFIKINRSFFAKEARAAYSAKALEVVQEVVARQGACLSAQGVESEDDSITLLTAGVPVQQGYYYTKDEAPGAEGDPAKRFLGKIVGSYDKFKKIRREAVRTKKTRFDATFKVVSSICAKLSGLSESRFDEACKTLVRNLGTVNSIFVVDEKGIQLTARAHVKAADDKRDPAKAIQAFGYRKGVDHSVYDYVVYLDMGYERFVTHRFISPLTGDHVCLISQAFYNSEGLRYIVCIETPHPG
jgi:EAL domain-containing protein (putative c-di-GMP-specific phosphodiesterase class I)